MRKNISIAMVLAFVVAMLTGIAEASPNHSGLPAAHIIIVSLFTAVLCIHLFLNRKALSRYFIPLKVEK